MASTSPASVEWERAQGEWGRAQQVQISVDLITAAERHLEFLAVVDRTPALVNRQVLKHAIKRYLDCWLPLAVKYSPEQELLPPLDCAWVWHCHKLNPMQYARDCRHLFGRLVDVGAPPPGSTNGEEEARAIWDNAYPDVPYQFVKAGQNSTERQQDILVNINSVDYDLLWAIERQSSFYFQVCRPWMFDRRFLQAALGRYRGFLHLIALDSHKETNGEARPFFVPTYDIDLLWHTHQLSPIAYKADTVRLTGKILNHDDSDGNREVGKKLHTGFVFTCELWLAAYGAVYEHAGSYDRRSKPARPVPPTPHPNAFETVIRYPANQKIQSLPEENKKLLPRWTMQVNLVVMGAEGVHPTSKTGRKTYFYVRVSALEKCPGLNLTTSPTECSSPTADEVVWNAGFSLQAELFTQGLRMELMSYTARLCDEDPNRSFVDNVKRKMRVMRDKPKCIGEASVEWQRDLLNFNTGLSLTKWVSLETKSTKTLRLHFSVSVTPPIPAPHIFRILPGPVTDDQGLQVAKLIPMDRKRQQGRWITRSVVDHTGQEQFVLRTRWATGAKLDESNPSRASGIMRVHEGSLIKLKKRQTKNFRHEPLVMVPPVYKYEANQLEITGPEPFHRKWSFSGNGTILKVESPVFYRAGGPEVQGESGIGGYPMRLLCGRWLEYEVADGLDKNEDKYLTLVRYTPDAPTGKATALINRESASIEVIPEESVVFVLMLANAISVSLVDMHFPPSTEVPLKNGKQGPTGSDLGAILLKRNGLSERWNKHSSHREPMYWEATHSSLLFLAFWWELTSTQINSSNAYGAKCGGGACRAGTCGGGVCTPDKVPKFEKVEGTGWNSSGNSSHDGGWGGSGCCGS